MQNVFGGGGYTIAYFQTARAASIFVFSTIYVYIDGMWERRQEEEGGRREGERREDGGRREGEGREKGGRREGEGREQGGRMTFLSLI
jgi:hypothetical protein